MKKRKAVWIPTFSGMLLALSCIVLGRALVAECSRLNGGYSMQKVLVSVKNQIDRQNTNSFSIEDIDKLKKELSTEDISYTAQSGLISTSVSKSGTALPVTLTGIDAMYPRFNGLTLKEGSFISQKQEEEGTMVAVIDDELARELFKTVKVTGKTVEIYDSVFRIIGVVEKEDTLIGRCVDDGLPDVYIPAAVMLELDTTARITALQIKTADTGTLDQNTGKVSLALRHAGKNPSNYNISDYNLTLAWMQQKPLLFVFILGIVPMLLLLAHVKRLIRKLYELIKDGCRKDYFLNVLRCNPAVIGTDMLEMVLALTGIALLWLGMRFRPYIPPRYIADELINLSYYSDLIKGIIQGGIQNIGYVAPRSELIVNTTDMLLNSLFWISSVLGCLLLYTGFRELRVIRINASLLTLLFGLLFILALGFLSVIAFLAGLPFLPDVKSILVIWAFIYLNILFMKGKWC